jgi:hypothetical protein
MKLKERIKYNIEKELYKNNVTIQEGNRIFLSHVNDNLFCIFTINRTYPFFTDSTPKKMNSFFKNLSTMLVSEDGSGNGCFDYETPSSNIPIKDKLYKYFASGNINFMLISYSKKGINLLSFFTFAGDYVWTLCTHFKKRNNGYMGILFKHFIKLFKSGELSEHTSYKENQLSLYLLRSNPGFDETRIFYEENGFTTKHNMEDKIIMHIKL